ncbi:Hypothetical predicted protein [Cloeon dipterum]|nr:Hypothetical predicted protein [Cloeon dipterum]
MAVGIFCVAMFCFITLLPHLIWGPGEDALSLTLEQGGVGDSTDYDVQLIMKRKTLCRAGFNDSLAGAECYSPGNTEESGIAPAFLLFLAQFISGIGGSLYYTLGTSYMDDNIKRSKTPALVSVTYFMKMLGPAVGYSLASFFLKVYIAPDLTPSITNTDPRWLGAWWAGWAVLGSLLLFMAFLISMFPQTMPRTIIRRREARARGEQVEQSASSEKASLSDMIDTVKRLLKNKIYMCNTLAAIFYMFGFMPFWMYTPKYIEVQYRVSAARASFFTGSVGLVFSAFGILISGFVITKFKPTARCLAMWNVFVSIIAVCATITYPFLGCNESDMQSRQMVLHKDEVQQACNLNCDCDFVKYSPVCSEDGQTTFISACHAGCRDFAMEDNKKIFTDCSCIPSPIGAAAFQLSEDSIEVSNFSVQDLASNNDSVLTTSTPSSFISNLPQFLGGRAFSGPCPVDCTAMFYSYIALVCLLKFTGASGRTSNFLVSVRCVSERDKATSLGFGMMLFSFFVFIPSPIIFGYIIDSTCVVWGKTCTRKGNCWLYEGESMRYIMNFTAAVFVAIGTLFDVGTWYYVKNLQIFEANRDENMGTKEERELINVQRADNGELAKPIKVADRADSE